MSDLPNKQNDNPLEELADRLSETLSSQQVDISESSVGQVEGGQVQMNQSAARSVKANALHLEESAAAFVRAGAIDVQDSAVGIVVADQAGLTDVTASLVVARQINATQVRAFAVIAPSIQGDVRSVLTPITAVAAGVGFALTYFLVRRVFSGIKSLMPRRHQRNEI